MRERIKASVTRPATTELILVRHAPARNDGLLAGRRDVPADCSDAQAFAAVRAAIGATDHRVASPALRCIETASALWPDDQHAAVAIPDGRKGEQIILVTTCSEATRADFVAWVQNHGVTELAVPRRLIHVHTIPILGTGKTDYVSVKRMVESAGGG